MNPGKGVEGGGRHSQGRRVEHGLDWLCSYFVGVVLWGGGGLC
jgi:hypothetical protein